MNISNVSTIAEIWRKTVTAVKKYPVVLLPFAIILLFDFTVLAVVFLAPRHPLSLLIAPVIRAFWGDKYLHYPANFLLIPSLFNYARNFFSFFIGIFFAGAAISFLHQIDHKYVVSWRHAFRRVFKSYSRLVIAWAVTLGIFFIVIRTFGNFTGNIESKKVVFAIEFSLYLIIQIMVVFVVPSIIIENKKVYHAFIRSIALVKNNLITIVVFVVTPALLLVPSSYLLVKMPVYMNRFFPEIALYIMIFRIIVLNIVDLVITISAAVLLLSYREKQNSGMLK
ncbi:hypothetical protein ACFLUV_00985 [Elusimicrobiota bacterium]